MVERYEQKETRISPFQYPSETLKCLQTISAQIDEMLKILRKSDDLKSQRSDLILPSPLEPKKEEIGSTAESSTITVTKAKTKPKAMAKPKAKAKPKMQ